MKNILTDGGQKNIAHKKVVEIIGDLEKAEEKKENTNILEKEKTTKKKSLTDLITQEENISLQVVLEMFDVLIESGWKVDVSTKDEYNKENKIVIHLSPPAGHTISTQISDGFVEIVLDGEII